MSTVVEEPSEITAREAGAMLLVVAARASRAEHELLGRLEEPLTFRQYLILLRVSEGYDSITQLAKLSHRTLPTISKSVDGMVRRGLLDRTSDESDRRAIELVLTEAGREALRDAQHAVQELGARLVEGLDGELDGFHRILHSVYDRAESELHW